TSQQDRTGLHGRFAQQHARNQWKVRVVTSEEPFVVLKRLAAHDPLVVALDDLVDQQERRSVRNGGFDFGAAHDALVTAVGWERLVFISQLSTSLATMTP